MTNAISVRRNEVNVVSLVDNESGRVVTGGQQKDGFELKELNVETSHAKVINPGFFKYLSAMGETMKLAGISDPPEGADKSGGSDKSDKSDKSSGSEKADNGGGCDCTISIGGTRDSNNGNNSGNSATVNEN